MLIKLARRASFWLALTACSMAVIAVGQDSIAPAIFQPPESSLESVRPLQSPKLVIDKPADSSPEPIELRPPNQDQVDIGTLPQKDGSMIKVMASLGAVLALFGLVAWVLRRKAPSAMRNLPKDAFEIYGRAALNSRQHVQLLRVGNRLLLVAVSANDAHTLAEITDTKEIDRILSACQGRTTGQAVTQPENRSSETNVPQHLTGLQARDELTYTEPRHE
ncbi:MAG: flagellar biosynthetic protein FliO [Planctomycetales bacterium]